MNFTLSSISKEKITLNRFLSSVENRRLINKSTSNFLEENPTSISFSYECHQCLKIFACEYGLNYHINMHHSNQSILCSDCHITFRSHRALKNHQQRFHPRDYSYISSCLFIPFSAQQFPFITKHACEQGRLPLGQLTSKLFQCQICYLSFPCSKALKYHLLNKHEQYEYKLCKNILYDIIIQVEQNLQTMDNDDQIGSIKFLLSKQAAHFGLVDKQLARETRWIKQEHNRLIFPSCQHQNRTCANLCLKYLSSYDKLIENYPYKILTLPKGNPFAQGSIVSQPINESSLIIPKDPLNSNQKHISLKRVKSSISDRSSSPQSKRKLLQPAEQQIKTNETKFLSIEQSSSILNSPKKILSSYARSLSSMSSNSSTSTRTSSKTSRQQTVTSLKRSISPTMTLAVERSSEKRRRQREQRKRKAASSSSSGIIIKINDDIEQENGDDDDIVSIKSEKSKQQRRNKQRQASNSSVEYVQIINNDKQSVPSLNNIENFKVKSNIDDKEIIICHSPPSVKKVISSSDKNHAKTSVNDDGIHKMNGHQTSDYDEHIRVRCKVCGDILEGRSRFSQHVLTMHSHLLKSNMSDIKQPQTTIVR